MELESLQRGGIQNELGLQKNIDAGLEYIEFGPDMRAPNDNAVMTRWYPSESTALGGPTLPSWRSSTGRSPPWRASPSRQTAPPSAASNLQAFR